MKVRREVEVKPFMINYFLDADILEVRTTEYVNEDQKEANNLCIIQDLLLDEEGKKLMGALRFWIERKLK